MAMFEKTEGVTKRGLNVATLQVFGAALAVVVVAGAAFGQNKGGYGGFKCSPDSLTGKTLRAAPYKFTDSLTFKPDNSFEYSVREGARTVVAVSGRFSLQQSNRSGEAETDRWPSGCNITFEPTSVEAQPSPAEVKELQNLAQFDGLKQTFWIDLWRGDLLLLDAREAENNPSSTLALGFHEGKGEAAQSRGDAVGSGGAEISNRFVSQRTEFATWRELIVSSGTVLDGQNKHHAALLPNVANNPVITNTITPQPAKLMTQGLPKAARVFVRGNAGIHIIEDFPLHGAVNGLEVFFNPWVVFNRPSQGFCVTGWR